MKRIRATVTRESSRLAHEQAAKPTPPGLRLDEQAIKFGLAIGAGQYDTKAHYRVARFADHDMAFRDLVHWKLDRIGVFEQVRAVPLAV